MCQNRKIQPFTIAKRNVISLPTRLKKIKRSADGRITALMFPTQIITFTFIAHRNSPMTSYSKTTVNAIPATFAAQLMIWRLKM